MKTKSLQMDAPLKISRDSLGLVSRVLRLKHSLPLQIMMICFGKLRCITLEGFMTLPRRYGIAYRTLLVSTSCVQALFFIFLGGGNCQRSKRRQAWLLLYEVYLG